MHKVATQAAQNVAALHVSAKRIGGGQCDCLEILRKLSDLGDFFCRPSRKYLFSWSRCANARMMLRV